MTIRQQINHGAIQKVCQLRNDTLTEKCSKYGVFSGPYFPVSVFSPNTGKYGPE